MEGLVKLSFYCFTAASLALVASAVCYIIYSVGRIRLRRTALAVPGGPIISSTTAEFTNDTEGFGRFGTMLLWFGVVFSFFAVLTRCIAAGRGPYSNMYEFSLGFLFAITLMYGIFERWYGTKSMGAIVLPIAVGMAGYIWWLPSGLREVDDLIPALQNQPLMTAHVTSAIFAYATFAVSFAAALLYLINRNNRYSFLPSQEMSDDIGFRAVTIGFPLLALVLVLGSVWAYRAWGTYWSWDPKETSALFTWLVYAVYLHTRTLRGWRGNRSAVILLIGFGAVIFTYYGNYFFGGLHAYGGV
ncbi:MAG TPA: c-type cytochrome biogenesis protein CcsB [Thermomicrobiales bacterium]|nr:c-type cytochrome biogenesis protein CcsB [Thermomicrobiales bacterium]